MMERDNPLVQALLATEDRKRKFHEEPEKEKVPVKDPEKDPLFKKLNDMASVLGMLAANKDKDRD